VDADQETDYHTPLTAWISFIMVSIGLVIFSFYYPMTEMKIGNSISIIPAVTISTALFLIMGFLSLKKSFHFF